MKKRKSWIPLAWCVEIEASLTPYQALSMLLNQDNAPLTFQCLECEQPLFLEERRQGFLNHPFFHGRIKESHELCLKNISLSNEARIWTDTLDDLTLVAKKAEKLQHDLFFLDVVHNTSAEGRPLDENDPGDLPLRGRVNLTPAMKSYKDLEIAVKNLERTYLEGWMTYILRKE